MASQGDSHVRGSINVADYTVQRLSMSDPVGLNFCNRFSIAVCLFCATPKYNPGDEILNRRGQSRGTLWGSRFDLFAVLVVVVEIRLTKSMLLMQCPDPGPIGIAAVLHYKNQEA